jgi:hypothetical protein
MASANRTLLIGLGIAAVACAAIAWISHGNRDSRLDRSADLAPEPERPISRAVELQIPVGEVELKTARKRVEAPTVLLDLLVTREDHIAVPDARIVAFKGKDVLAQSTTDSDGRAKLDASARDTSIAVLATGHLLFVEKLGGNAGSRTIVLPDGKAIRGRVEADGGPPGETVALKLTCWLAGGSAPALPAKVARAFAPELTPAKTISIATDAEGKFTVRGLPADIQGSFECASSFYVSSTTANPDSRSTETVALEDGMLVSLGRALEPRLSVAWENGEPVSGTVWFKFGRDQKRSKSLVDGNLVDAQLPRVCGPELDLWIRPDGASKYAIENHYTAPPGASGPWDLGSVTLEGLRSVTLQLKTSDGRPLTKVSVTAGNAKGAVQSRSFDEVTQTLRVGIPKTVTALSLSAPGYEPLDTRPAENVDFTAVTLTCVTRLSLSLTGLEEATDDLQLVLPARTMREGDRQLVWKDRWTIERVPTGVPVKVEVRTKLSKLAEGDGHTLCTIDLEPFTKGEQRDVAFAPPFQGRMWSPEISMPDGQPARSARVTLLGPERQMLLNADAEGKLTFGPLFGDCVEFTVKVAGRKSEKFSRRSLESWSHAVRLGSP